MGDARLFTKALIYAADKHKNQERRGGTPYIYHPIKVAEIVKEAGYGIEYQIVALLHDTLEDTDATEEEIREFGEDVLTAVKLLTRAEGADEEEYIKDILQNHLAAVVKNADKINNLYDAAYCEDREWALGYINKSKRYYKDKFSEALDNQLGLSKSILSTCKAQKEPLFVDKEKMELYVAVAK